MKKLSTKRKIALVMAFILFTATLGYFALGYDDAQDPVSTFGEGSATTPPAMGIIPLGNGLRVDFDNNHVNAVTGAGHLYRDTIMLDGGNSFRPIEAGDTLGDGMPVPPERTDMYVFMSWNTQPDGSGDVFDANTEIHDSITVYAQWGWGIYFSVGSVSATAEELAILMPGLGERSATPDNPQNWGHRYIYVPDSGSTTIDDLAGVAWPDNPTAGVNPGYRFIGWRTTVGSDICDHTFCECIDGDTVMTGTIFLVALWRPVDDWVVTFDYGPGVLTAGHSRYRDAVPNLSITDSWLHPHYRNRTFVYQRSAPEARLAGATLQGWWTGTNGTGTRFAAPGRASLTSSLSGYNSPVRWAHEPVYEDMTVYAWWVYRATFNPNGGTWYNTYITPALPSGTPEGRIAHRGRDVPVFAADGITPLTGKPYVPMALMQRISGIISIEQNNRKPLKMRRRNILSILGTAYTHPFRKTYPFP